MSNTNGPSNKGASPSHGKQKEQLGMGIRSLLKNIDADLKTSSGQLRKDVIEKTTSVNVIPIDQIIVNPLQPRQDFDEKALQELSDSILLHGIIQPLTVSIIAPNKYRLIAGERRLRASKMAGIKEVPVYLREVNDQQLLELALLENLQREDLNAIEIGLSYQRLMDECSLTQEQVAKQMGKERSTVANYIGLLKLPPDIIVEVRKGTLSMGHARALIGIKEVEKQIHVFKKIVRDGLSVRQTEELVRELSPKDKSAAAKPKAEKTSTLYKQYEDKIGSHFGTRAIIQHHKSGRGTITLEYYSIDNFNAILDKLNLSGQ